MKISYLVTIKNETSTFFNLMEMLLSHIDKEDEIIILDDFSDNVVTKDMVEEFLARDERVSHHLHALEKDYGGHKNYGNNICKGDFIFQIDGDELPSELLLVNIKDIIINNNDVELFWVPRLNNFLGVTLDDAKRWGWSLTESMTLTTTREMELNGKEYVFLKNTNLIIDENTSESGIEVTYKIPMVMWPDYQSRIYKNDNSRIKWIGKLHEKVSGESKFALIPAEEEISLQHIKTIQKQTETNVKYNTLFSENENRGHSRYQQ